MDSLCIMKVMKDIVSMIQKPKQMQESEIFLFVTCSNPFSLVISKAVSIISSLLSFALGGIFNTSFFFYISFRRTITLLYNNVIVRLSAFFVNYPLFFRGIVCPLSEELSGSSIALHYCDINATLYQPAAVHISRSLSAYSYRKNCEACMLPFLEHINHWLLYTSRCV